MSTVCLTRRSPIPRGVRDSAGALIIGAQLPVSYNRTYGNIGWDGIIDRVGIRSDSLTDQQVLDRYNSL